MHHHSLSNAQKKYLITMTKLDPEARGIRSVNIAKELNITRPSVHAMLTRLSDEGYVVKEHYGIVYLTQKGLNAGNYLIEKQ